MVNKVYKYHYIYKTTNLINDKYYYGMHSTDDVNDGYLGSGKILRASVKKYGVENFKFEILEYLPDRKSLKEREREIVNQEQVDNKLCMNLKLGGHGGFSSEVAKKGRKALVKKYKDKLKDWAAKGGKAKFEKYGMLLPHYDWTGRKHSEESKKKQSEVKKGTGTKEKNSQFGTMWITNGIENKKIKKDSLIPQGWSKGRLL